jgi:hypothetical protein
MASREKASRGTVSNALLLDISPLDVSRLDDVF